jgi:hypothetical protein
MVDHGPSAEPCPLCGEAVGAGPRLDALGKHFETCRKTRRVLPPSSAAPDMARALDAARPRGR